MKKRRTPPPVADIPTAPPAGPAFPPSRRPAIRGLALAGVAVAFLGPWLLIGGLF